MTETYIFYGRILPERVNFNIRKLECFAPELNYKFTLVCHYSRIIVECITPKKVDNILQLKGVAENCVKQIADVYGFVIACAYDVEIENVYHVSEKIGETFDVHVNIFNEKINESTNKGVCHPDFSTQHLNPDIFLRLTGECKELQIALSDFREAVKQPNFTAFHCYRVLDGLKYAAPSRRGKDSQWEWLLKELKITKATRNKLMKAGGEQRHGKVSAIPWEERKWALQIAWETIKRFIYLKLDKTMLEKLSGI